MDRTDVCVIVNPAAGRRRAGRRLEKLRRRWGAGTDFRPTQGPGHAEELALEAARAGFRVVAAAGGDGTVHEVANGLLRAGRPDVLFSILPVGSANDYEYSLEQEGWKTVHACGLPVQAVDVGVVQDLAGRTRYFINSLGLGLNGAVTLESRKIKRLQGLALYGLATLRALWYRFASPVMTIGLDDAEWQTPTLLMSVALGQREGGFVLAPRARLGDGLFEYLHAADLSRWEVLRFLPRLARSGPPENYPKVRIGRCRQVRVRSEAPLVVHIDGEFFCRPEDRLCEIHIQLRPLGLQVCQLPGVKEALSP